MSLRCSLCISYVAFNNILESITRCKRLMLTYLPTQTITYMYVLYEEKLSHTRNLNHMHSYAYWSKRCYLLHLFNLSATNTAVVICCMWGITKQTHYPQYKSILIISSHLQHCLCMGRKLYKVRCLARWYVCFNVCLIFIPKRLTMNFVNFYLLCYARKIYGLSRVWKSFVQKTKACHSENCESCCYCVCVCAYIFTEISLLPTYYFLNNNLRFITIIMIRMMSVRDSSQADHSFLTCFQV